MGCTGFASETRCHKLSIEEICRKICIQDYSLMPDQQQILLQTKLHRPRVPRDLVLRPRLLERLNHGLNGRLTVVSGPPGYGKSTLVGSWIDSMAGGPDHDSHPLPVMWLSLDENDRDILLFIRYFVAAIQSHFPGTCTETLELVQAINEPPMTLLANTLSNELDHLPGDFILVLDDYSSIHGQAVHNFLSAILLHSPRTMHLVLITRTSPPLPLPSLRVRGEVNEIRGKDLRFSRQDTAAYMRKVLPTTLNENALALLEEHTDGWIALLKLVALSMRSVEDPDRFLASLSSADTDLAGYMIDEVLLHQPPAIQKFLLKTSILDRFSVSLCQAVVGKDDPEINVTGCLEWVENANLFFIPLDNQHQWYRYHHLFRELLERRLQDQPEQVSTLHLHAATWFAGHDLVEEAIHHAILAADLDLAAVLMERGLRDLLNREDNPTMERWLRMLPEDFIQKRPGLLIMRVWIEILKAHFGEPLHSLQQVEDLLLVYGESLPTEELRELRGQVAGLHAQHQYFTNQPKQAILLFQESLALLPGNWYFLRGRVMMYLGMSMNAIGQNQEAERLLLDWYEALGDKSGPEASSILMALGINHLQLNRLRQAADYFEAVLRQTTYDKMPTLRIWAFFFLAEAHYYLNELEICRQHLAEIIDHRYSARPTHFYQALAGTALIDQIENHPIHALEMVEELSQLDLEKLGYETTLTQSTRARLWLLQGNLAGAGRWADAFLEPLPDQPLLWIETPHMTRVRVLLARNSGDDVQVVVSLLDEMTRNAERTHNTRILIELLAMRALALDSAGKPDEALTTLEQALQLAGPGGNTRVFVDLGPPMQEMLKDLAGQDKLSAEIRPILAAFPEAAPAVVTPTGKLHPPASTALAEPLTDREYDILVLLSLRMSNKEISQTLNISPLTVKRHVLNVCRKLGVNRRQDAVAQAIALGFIPLPGPPSTSVPKNTS
jgi:LuxR family transcriptional regulator, maltose regulon positive regulatory protein